MLVYSLPGYHDSKSEWFRCVGRRRMNSDRPPKNAPWSTSPSRCSSGQCCPMLYFHPTSFLDPIHTGQVCSFFPLLPILLDCVHVYHHLHRAVRLTSPRVLLSLELHCARCSCRLRSFLWRREATKVTTAHTSQSPNHKLVRDRVPFRPHTQ